jgi:hypothetical protein
MTDLVRFGFVLIGLPVAVVIASAIIGLVWKAAARRG